MLKTSLLLAISGAFVNAQDLTAASDVTESIGQQSRQLEPHAGVYTVGNLVYDGTNQTTAATLRRIIPTIFSESFILPMQNDAPEYWSIAFTKATPLGAATPKSEQESMLSSGGIISDAIKEALGKQPSAPSGQPYEPKDDYLNALFTYPAPILSQKQTTHIRFIEIPDSNGSYTDKAYSFGLTKYTSFGANYNITGLFHGSQGNLQLAASPSSSSIGAASHALRADFSDSSRNGRAVDFYIETSADGQNDVYIAVGGRSYGHAFDIPPLSTSTDIVSPLSLLPGVRFDVNQTMAVCVILWTPFPTPADAPYRRMQAASGTGMTGEWIIPEDRSNANEVKPKFIMRITDGASELSSLTREVSLTITVVNILKVKYKVGLLGQILSRSPILSTRMAGPPEMMEVETNIVKLLQCAEILTINDTKQLLVKCANDSMKQLFDSYVDTSDRAITLNPWLSR